MSNMSYCRFRNTDKDLLDCQLALEEMSNDPGVEPLRGEELDAAKSLVERCFQIAASVAEVLNMSVDNVLEGNVSALAGKAVDYINNTPKEG